MPTRVDVLARLAAVEPDGGASLAWVLGVLAPLYPGLDAGTPDQLLSRLGDLHRWRAGEPVAGAVWSDGEGLAGFAEKVILGSTDFLAVTSTGRRQRLPIAGKAFVVLKGG